MVEIKKTKELFFDNNDIYLLQNHTNIIIINDNYHGLLLLDFSFNIIQKILFDGETTIYSLYKEFNGSHLMVYSPDEEQITLIDSSTSNNYSIKLTQTIHEDLFSANYYWHRNVLIIATFGNIFYRLCFATNQLKEIIVDEVKNTCPIFFNFWNESKNYNIVTNYPEKFSFIFQENDPTIGFIDTRTNQKIIISDPSDGWHDIQYANNTFIFIYEKKLKIVHNNTESLFYPDSGYIFLKAEFISETTIAVLSSKPENHRDSLLQIYQLINK